MIDIEEELKSAQIKHIQKELEQLRFYYSDITDLEFLHIICGYEELLEIAVKDFLDCLQIDPLDCQSIARDSVIGC